MSEGILNTQIDGTTIQVQHVNQYKNALVEDILPRNLSGTNEDEGGSLGSDIYRWLKGIISTVFTNKLSIGSAGNEATNPYLNNLSDNLYLNAITSKSVVLKSGTTSSIVTNATQTEINTSSGTSAVFDVNGMSGAYLTNLSVDSSKLSSNAVTEAKIQNGSVTEDKIGSLAVTSGKIASSAVLNAKIAAGSVSPDKLSNRVVTTANITHTEDKYFSESSSITPSGGSYANGASVVVSVSGGAAAIAWYVTSTNSFHRCGITLQPDSAVQVGAEGGMVVATGNTTITARVYNTDGSNQTGTVTLTVYVLR